MVPIRCASLLPFTNSMTHSNLPSELTPSEITSTYKVSLMLQRCFARGGPYNVMNRSNEPFTGQRRILLEQADCHPHCQGFWCSDDGYYGPEALIRGGRDVRDIRVLSRFRVDVVWCARIIIQFQEMHGILDRGGRKRIMSCYFGFGQRRWIAEGLTIAHVKSRIVRLAEMSQ